MNIKKKYNNGKSKYYYEVDRNLPYIESNTIDSNTKINYKNSKTPSYYIGTYFGYKAKDIIRDFELNYNIGTAVTYLLRAGKKSEEGLTQIEKLKEDLIKAKNHLDFELETLEGGGK